MKSELPASRSCQAYCMICISNRGLAGGLASHHCWPSTGRGAIRRGASRVGCAGISGCAAGRARPQAGAADMDVHAGNYSYESGLRLIDWEYAGDGDIALELAAVEHRRAPSAGRSVCPAGGHRRAAALAAGCTLAPVGTAVDGGLV